jgi:hypothetical protein
MNMLIKAIKLLGAKSPTPQIDAKSVHRLLAPLSRHLGCVSLTTKEAHMHLLSGLDTIHPPQLEVFVLLCGVQTETIRDLVTLMYGTVSSLFL